MADRIASLLPAATEIVALLGLQNRLVARTHECDFPPGIDEVPAVTYSSLDGAHLSSSEIDQEVSNSLNREHQGSSLYGIRETVWRSANPDLVLTQELCDVCAVNYDKVVDAARLLQGKTTIISLEPTTIAGMLQNIRTVGEVTGTGARAQRRIAELESRLAHLQEATTGLSRRRVLCIEWLDPIYNGGHWVPEQVALAGGAALLAEAGAPSRSCSWEEVLQADPEILVLLPCGFDVDRIVSEVHLLRTRPGWRRLPAVRRGEVYAVNGHAYFNRPGPRLVDGAELLAGLLHPDQFPEFRSRFAGAGGWQRVVE